MRAPRRSRKVTSSMSRFLQPEDLDALEDVDEGAGLREQDSDPVSVERMSLELISGRQGGEGGELVSEVGGNAAVVSPLSATTPPAAEQHELLKHGRRRERKREIAFTPNANAVLEQLVSLYASATGSVITPSHVLRGILLAAEPVLDQIADGIRAVGPLKRPGNDSKYTTEREAFERTLGEAFLKGGRNSES